MKKLIVLLGESGSGKDYFMNKIVEQSVRYKEFFPEIKPIVKVTTRPIRLSEVGDDVPHYEFVNMETYTMNLLK